METNTKPANTSFNKYAYAAFVMAGIVFLAIKDYSQASMFLGLGLVFDPFNQATPFNKRPLWQRAWLIFHLGTTLVLFVLLLTKTL